MQSEIAIYYQQKTYKPTIALDKATKQCSLARIPLVSTDTDRQETMCGYARRVGYCGSKRDDFALYRIKLRVEGNRYPLITLPGLFILKEGSFSPTDGFAP
jgi:hypothetical protein